MRRKDTVIFDLDGTLLDTLDDLTNSTNYALTTWNYPKRTRYEVCSFVGNGIRRLIQLALPGGENNPDFEKVFETFKNHYAVHCNDNTRAYPGIPELLAGLKKEGYDMAIVSNKADPAVKELAEIYFSGEIPIAIGEKESQGIQKKPAPDTVFEAMRQLGTDVDRSVYVGDSEVDVATAANAGMDAVICAWGFRTEEVLRKAGAKVIIHRPEELILYLKGEN